MKRRTVCALQNLLHLCEHLCQLVGLWVVQVASQQPCVGRRRCLGRFGDVYLCGPLRPLEFCDMVSGLLRKIGGVCPCTGSPKEKGHLVGSRGCRRRWRGRGVGRSLQGRDLTITERDAASLKNGNDARRHCPWQGEPGCPNKSAMPAWIPGRRQMTRSYAALAQVVFEFGEMQVGGKRAAGAKKAHALAWRPWQPHLPCNRQNNKPESRFATASGMADTKTTSKTDNEQNKPFQLEY